VQAASGTVRATMQQIEDKSSPVLGYRAVSVLTALMVLAQPILAGQFVYGGEPDMKDVHAVVGQSLHITVLIQLVLAFIARRTFGIGLVIFNVILLILVAIQAAIGFSSDGNVIASTSHWVRYCLRSPCSPRSWDSLTCALSDGWTDGQREQFRHSLDSLDSPCYPMRGFALD